MVDGDHRCPLASRGALNTSDRRWEGRQLVFDSTDEHRYSNFQCGVSLCVRRINVGCRLLWCAGYDSLFPSEYGLIWLHFSADSLCLRRRRIACFTQSRRSTKRRVANRLSEQNYLHLRPRVPAGEKTATHRVLDHAVLSRLGAVSRSIIRIWCMLFVSSFLCQTNKYSQFTHRLRPAELQPDDTR